MEAAVHGLRVAFGSELYPVALELIADLVAEIKDGEERRQRARTRLTCGIIASMSACVTTAILATGWLPIVCAVSMFWLAVTDWLEDGEG